MIRNLIRAAAALPLGAFALAALPHDIASATAPLSVDIEVSNGCYQAFGGDFAWMVDVDNDSAEAVKVTLVADGVKWSEMTIPSGGGGQLTAGGSEGLPSSLQVLVDGQQADSGTIDLVDCHADGATSAAINLVCPGPESGEGEDIAVIYSMTVDGTAVEFAFGLPDGAESTKTVSDTSESFGAKVFQGDVIDVWVERTDTNEVLASLQTTVDCTDDEQVQDTPMSDQASEGTLPATGGGSTLAWMALGTTLAGAAAIRLAQRRPVATVDEAGK